MDWIARLARDLAEEGGHVEIDAATGHLLIGGRDEEHRDPPVRLSITPAQLQSHLAALAEDAGDVFPDVAPLQAAYQLFLVHLDETLAMNVVAGSELRLADGKLSASPERHVSLDMPKDAGPLMFVSPEQFTRMQRALRRTGRAARRRRRSLRRQGPM